MRKLDFDWLLAIGPLVINVDTFQHNHPGCTRPTKPNLPNKISTVAAENWLLEESLDKLVIKNKFERFQF